MPTLTATIQALPPDLQHEVEDFIEFLLLKHRRRQEAGYDRLVAPAAVSQWEATPPLLLAQPTGEGVGGEGQRLHDPIWGSDEDDIYADLLAC